MTVHYLYAIRLPVNDFAVSYIGVTNNLSKRKSAHVRNKERSLIGTAIAQCGGDQIIFEPLESGERDLIYRREVDAIAAFNTRYPDGYNLAAGGIGGRDPLPSTRAKLVVAQVGQIRSPITRKRMAAAKVGQPSGFKNRTQSREARRKMLFSRLRLEAAPARFG